ncbi:uncharacterized protein [Channa argus]|uniref:uncharacterized protein isoform X1 n=1 Tax=Channa argus TaxID=215402 RepID=UPI0035220CB2
MRFCTHRNDSEMPTGSGSENESRDAKEDEDEVIVLSDAESQSLLSPVETSKEPQSLPPSSAEVVTPTISTANPIVGVVKAEDVKQKKDGGCRPEQRPVHIPGQHTVGTSVPQQSSTGTSPSPDHLETHSVTGSHPWNIACVSPDSPKTACITVFSSSSSVTHLEPSIDSVSFWKSCTMAGCSQAIFADFINEMNNVFSRIQSNQASQEDYDLALRVMASSGKLFGLVDKQQKELQRKQGELKKAAEALKDVVSALRR